MADQKQFLMRKLAWFLFTAVSIISATLHCGFHSFYIFHSKNEFLFLKIKFWPLFRWLIWRWKLDCCQIARTEKKTLVWNKFLNKLIRFSFLETQLSYLKAAAHYFIVQCMFTKNKQLGIPKNYRLDRKINDTARFALTVNILKLRCQLFLSLNLTRGSVPEILHCFFKVLRLCKILTNRLYSNLAYVVELVYLRRWLFYFQLSQPSSQYSW